MASSARIDEIKKKFDENPRRYFAPLANEFRKAGDLEQAILICEEFLPQQAGHMSGHIVYGQALYEAGRLLESKSVFETALGLDPENLIALRHLGDIARSQGDAADARRWYDRVLEADPRNDEIQALIQSVDTEAGHATAQRALEPSPPALPTPPQGMSAPTAQPHVARPELSPIDLDMDDAAFATPAATSSHLGPVASSDDHAPAPWTSLPPDTAGFAVSGLEATSAEQREPAERSDMMHGRAAGLEPAEFEVPAMPMSRAEGLEPAEFEVPVEMPARAEGLETAEYESAAADSTDGALLDLEGSFAAETHAGAPDAGIGAGAVTGLEEAGAAHPHEPDDVVMPMLDLDQSFTVAPHGDAVAHPGAPAADAAADAPRPALHDPRMGPPAAMEAMPALADLPLDTGADGPPMMELSPQVLAAESELMDVPDDYGFADEATEPVTTVSAGRAPFVTETMAELYLKQGFTAQALEVYRQLAQASPSDARLRDRVASLESEAARAGGTDTSGPSVRDFFFRLATRRPHERAAEATPPSAADFASFDAVPELPGNGAARASAAEPPVHATREEPASSAPAETPARPAISPPVPASAAPMPSAAARGATAQGGKGSTGSIDALFGGRTSGTTSSDSAASALAQAFGGANDAPVLSGRAAHTAAGELSLDSVFRDGAARPPRISQGFAFDQFFSDGATDAAASGAPATPAAGATESEPAERGADEVKEFNAWLQGLKPR